MILRNAIFCLFMLLFTFGTSYGQISSRSFFKNSRVGIGLNFSRILSDSVYDVDLGRFLVSYSYGFSTPRNTLTEIGAKYTVRGGKSFDDDVYTAIGYLDFPLVMYKKVSDGFMLGGGVQPSALLFEKIKYRGANTNADPLLYSRLPSKTDLSVLLSTNISMSPRSRLSISTAYSLLSSSQSLRKLNFLSFEGQVNISLGKSIENISTSVTNRQQDDLDFVKLERGVVVVVLSKKEKLITYYRDRGKIEEAANLEIDVDRKNVAFMNAFREKFDFCEVVFIYSDMCSKAQQGDLSAKIFDGEYKQREIRTLNDKKYVFLKLGNIYGKTSSFNKTGYHFEDALGIRLDDPYPSLNSLGSRGELEANKLIFRLNQRLKGRSEDIKSTKYYQKTQSGL